MTSEAVTPTSAIADVAEPETTAVADPETPEMFAAENGKFACRYCHKTYSSAPSLRTHEKWHTGELKHQCNFCAKRFRNPSEVKRHEMTHTGENRNLCHFVTMEVTNVLFRYPYKPYYHSMTHTVPFKIKIIDKKVPVIVSDPDSQTPYKNPGFWRIRIQIQVFDYQKFKNFQLQQKKFD
jgi:hypothetical protein